ncbi:MAG: response regulator [Hespellia sp.]|nr:response regulator [Hespellia sp.]
MEKLKVFLVEDEYVVREGIKNSIDWELAGYDFCGETSDGELAYSMIQQLKPDIVITDIKMPFMDGLTLSKLLKKDMPWIEIMILTGYAEFDYAKEAIRIGVAEYLTKPINSEELLKEIGRLADKIEEKRKERELRETYQREMQENSLRERKEFFQQLVAGEKTPAELFEVANRLQLDISAIWYSVVLLQVHFQNRDHSEYSNTLIAMEEKIVEYVNRNQILLFDRNLEGVACVFKADTTEIMETMQSDFIEMVQQIVSEKERMDYFVGVGEPVERLRELRYSFESANHAFAHRYLVDGSLVLYGKDIHKQRNQEKDEFHLESVSPKQMNKKKMQEFLKVGHRDESPYFVEEFFQAFDTNAMESNVFRQYITMDTYFGIAEFVEGLGYDKSEIPAPDLAEDVWKSKASAISYVKNMIEKALELRERAASNQYDILVEKVKSYIEENYADEDLTQNVVAAYVNYSPNHLSTIFSQETGQTFSKYLTDFRMNKAKELLRCTAKRSSEISKEVGYKDSHYFSFLFKKTQDMTPTQYRLDGKTDGEEIE